MKRKRKTMKEKNGNRKIDYGNKKTKRNIDL